MLVVSKHNNNTASLNKNPVRSAMDLNFLKLRFRFGLIGQRTMVFHSLIMLLISFLHHVLDGCSPSKDFFKSWDLGNSQNLVRCL